jgi:hypothetical protein
MTIPEPSDEMLLRPFATLSAGRATAAAGVALANTFGASSSQWASAEMIVRNARGIGLTDMEWDSLGTIVSGLRFCESLRAQGLLADDRAGSYKMAPRGVELATRYSRGHGLSR